MPDLDDVDARSSQRGAGADGGAPSRRSVLRVAAGAGAAGVAATALSRIPGTLAGHARPGRDDAGAEPARPLGEHPGEPIVVHVRDASAGSIEIFHGTSVTELSDRDLAARIVRASR